MNGDVQGRHNLACLKWLAGNHHRAYKHLIIAAKAGFKLLDKVKVGYMMGLSQKMNMQTLYVPIKR